MKEKRAYGLVKFARCLVAEAMRMDLFIFTSLRSKTDACVKMSALCFHAYGVINLTRRAYLREMSHVLAILLPWKQCIWTYKSTAHLPERRSEQMHQISQVRNLVGNNSIRAVAVLSSLSCPAINNSFSTEESVKIPVTMRCLCAGGIKTERSCLCRQPRTES